MSAALKRQHWGQCLPGGWGRCRNLDSVRGHRDVSCQRERPQQQPVLQTRNECTGH
jgi:hypothetical protein